MGGKKSDLWAVPLCRTCHTELHSTTLKEFEQRWQIRRSLYRYAIMHRIRYLQST